MFPKDMRVSGTFLKWWEEKMSSILYTPEGQTNILGHQSSSTLLSKGIINPKLGYMHGQAM